MQNLNVILLAKDVRALCEKDGIVIQAFPSPGARSLGMMDNKVVKNIASWIWVSEAQVSLRHGCALLPKSAKEEWMKSNRGNWGFKLSKEDMEELDSLNKSKEGRTPSEGGLGSRTLTFTDSTATRPLYALI